MNWSWWDGRMSLEHYKGEHVLDTETILQAMRQETEVADSEQEGVGDRREMRQGNDAPRQDDPGT
ncbi:MAG: hypothetical protein ABR881_27030 [Candidatus Sulfotelmatobacter sp.]